MQVEAPKGNSQVKFKNLVNSLNYIVISTYCYIEKQFFVTDSGKTQYTSVASHHDNSYIVSDVEENNKLEDINYLLFRRDSMIGQSFLKNLTFSHNNNPLDL